MRIAILGGPGSGKGTQARLLSEQYRVPHIATGDLLREALKNDKKPGKQVQDAMNAGQLVDDEVVLKLLDERLRKKDTKRGFIIDGYPRNIPQAQSLDALLGLLGRTLQVAVNLNVDDDILIKRISGRMLCAKCGAIYNKHFSPPKSPNVCDECGGKKFSSRGDDNVKTAEVRVQIYHDNTEPLLAYYRAQHKMRTVGGSGKVEEIQEKLCDMIDLEIRPLEIKALETASETPDEVETTIIAGGQINRVEVEKRRKKKKKRSAKPTAAKPAKKAVSKKAAKPATAKKTAKKVPKKKVAKKAAKKVSTKKAAAKKAVSKKPATKKPASKKPTKIVAKKAAAKTTAAKKTTKKKLTKKTAVKKKVAKKKAAKKR